MANVSFYSKNRIDDDSTLTATSANTALFANLYDNDDNTNLISLGSDDLTPEAWEIEFSGQRTIDSIHISNHNIKSGKIEYWDGAAWDDVSPTISWSANTATSNIFSFTKVSTTKIRLTMDTTIVADAEKSVGELRALDLIGTVERNPSKSDPRWKEKARKMTTDDNSSIYVFFGSKFNTKMKFENATDADLALFRSLKDLGTPFYVYLNGGDTTQTQEGFRIQDMYLVNYTNEFRYKLQKGHLTGVGVKIDLDLAGAY